MKIVEAIKQVKYLTNKARDIEAKIGQYCADMDFEAPFYENQAQQLKEWQQSHKDIVREIGKLKYLLTKTNVMTKATVVIDGHEVNKSLSEWIERRRLLSELELRGWKAMTDKGLKAAKAQKSDGSTLDVRVRLYFDPKARDRAIEVLSSEPTLIDSKLEIVNATTDLLD